MEMLDWGRAVQHCGSAAPRHMKYIKWHFDGHSFRMVIRGWDLELASARSMRLDVIFRCSMRRWARHQSYHYIHHLLYYMMSKDKDWAYHIFPEQRCIINIKKIRLNPIPIWFDTQPTGIGLTLRLGLIFIELENEVTPLTLNLLLNKSWGTDRIYYLLKWKFEISTYI